MATSKNSCKEKEQPKWKKNQDLDLEANAATNQRKKNTVEETKDKIEEIEGHDPVPTKNTKNRRNTRKINTDRDPTVENDSSPYDQLKY